MIEQDCGLIYRTRPLTETSLIVHWLAERSGRIATVAKGAHRPKSPFRGKLDIFFEAEFTFDRSRRSELHTLREISLHDTHARLRQDLGWLQQSAYAIHLVEISTEAETPLPGFYELVRDFVACLPEHPPHGKSVLAFELRLLDELGLQPSREKIGGLAKYGAELGMLESLDWRALGATHLSDVALRDIARFLHGFLLYHLGRLPAGRSEALA